MMVGWPGQVLDRAGTGAPGVTVDAGVGLTEELCVWDTEVETEVETEFEYELLYELEVVSDTEVEVVIDTVLEIVMDTVFEVEMVTVPDHETVPEVDNVPVPEMEGVFVAAWAVRRHDSRTAKTTKDLDIMFS